MDASRRHSWIAVIVFVGVAYAVIGVGSAALDDAVWAGGWRPWRVAAVVELAYGIDPSRRGCGSARQRKRFASTFEDALRARRTLAWARRPCACRYSGKCMAETAMPHVFAVAGSTWMMLLMTRREINATDDDPSPVQPVLQLRIPGPWESREAFLDALEEAALGYDVDGAWLVHHASGRRFELTASPHDDEIADVFAGAGRVSEEDVERIDAHAVKLHLTLPFASRDDTRAIMDAAAAVVRAGGFGVMIDNSGNCHGPGDWLKLAGDPQPGGMYWAFVVVTHGTEGARGATRATGREVIWSTGMHCLGLRDAEMPAPEDLEYGGFVLHNFLGYTYQSGAEMNDGDPIGDESGITHRVRHAPCTRFEPGSPFHNPFGVWRLEPVGDEEPDAPVT